MKKTFTISINNTPFTIEEDAYQKLDSYLTEIKQYFTGNEDKDEIVRDIEARIAEKLSEFQHSILTLTDVTAVIADMGTVNDFDGQEKGPKVATKRRKHLYRDTDNAIIAGVAAGLGHYFSLSPSVVRMLFIIVVILGGSGILLYLILWFIIPEAETTAQKLEMNGDPVTIATMSASFKEKIEEIDTENIKHGMKKLLAFPLTVLRGFAKFIQRFIFPSIRIIFGGMFMVGGFVTAIGITVALGLGLFGVPLNTFTPFESLTQSVTFYAFAVSLYFVVFIPAILIFLSGLKAITRKSYIGQIIGWSLFVIWCLAIVMTAVTGSRIAVSAAKIAETEPVFQTETRTITPDAFSKLSAANSMHITYVKGAQYSLTLEGRAYDLDRLQTTVARDTLMIDQKNFDQAWCIIYCTIKPITITVTAPTLSEIRAQDVARIDGTIQTDSPFVLAVRDASAATVTITTPELRVTGRDVARATITGTADKAVINLSDASRFKGQDFTVKKAVITTTDVARAEIHVIETLNVDGRDASSVRYSGTPEITQTTRDAASVKLLEVE